MIKEAEWAEIVALVAVYAGLRDGTNAWQAVPQAAREAVEAAAKRLPRFATDAHAVAYAEAWTTAPTPGQSELI
jgi:hypothetical protein